MADADDLKHTPLDGLHRELGGKMVPFAGYSMPVQYPAGVMKEHLHTREKAGLFDVSHMGQVRLVPKSGERDDAARAFERIVPVGVLGLKTGRQRYAMFTNDQGGILDDLMFAARDGHLFVVVNAACKDADIAHMREHLSDDCEIEVLDDRALLALQGPRAAEALGSIAEGVGAMKFMDVADTHVAGVPCIVSRSGYSGEDGYEISISADRAVEVAEKLLAHDAVAPIGLGARDSLRLEAGLCLYGNDIDTGTTPVEAALEWAIQKARRRGGERAGGFPGADVILGQLENGTDRLRVGIKPAGRAPMREGTRLYAGEDADQTIGTITSGGFGPSVEGPVAMGYVPTGKAEPGTRLFGEVRGKRMPAEVAALPFVKPGYKRN